MRKISKVIFIIGLLLLLLWDHRQSASGFIACLLDSFG